MCKFRFTWAIDSHICSLQDDPVTNAGRGANLTESGHVECDASIMDGCSGAFGAVGAVRGTCSWIFLHMPDDI